MVSLSPPARGGGSAPRLYLYEYIAVPACALLVSFLVAATPLATQAVGVPLTQVHLIMNCGNPGEYWDMVRQAGEASLSRLASSTCIETPEDAGRTVDSILAQRPPPEESRVAILVGNGGSMAPSRIHYARAIKEGILCFFIENPIDIEKHGLDFNKHLIVNLMPDNAQGARFTGQELCRTTQDSYQRIALIYGADPIRDERVDTALATYMAECPNAQVHVPYKKRGDWSTEGAQRTFEALFLVDSTITSVLCANDRMALGVFKAADKILGASKASQLHVTGFDHSDYILPYLRSRRMISTVNQGTTIANDFIWSILPKVIDLVDREGINTTAQLQDMLGLEGSELRTEVKPVAADKEGYLLTKVDEKYKATVRAVPFEGEGPTNVKVGVHDFRVEAIDTAEGSFSATFWLQSYWKDSRLIWNPTVFPGKLTREHGTLWEPYVYPSNIISSHAESYIGTTPLTVSSDGTVSMATKITGDFACIMNVESYPFDIHHCTIDISVAAENYQIALAPAPGQQDLVDMPESFIGKCLKDDAEVISGTYSPTGLNQTTVVFKMMFRRKTSFVSSTYILTVFGLNMVSFGCYWIVPDDGNMDRSGLAITTILASMVLQADARSTLVSTWLDTYFVTSISFQFITFFMSVITAHYAFDFDYKTEREQHLMESEKQIESLHKNGKTVKQGTLDYYAGQFLRVSDSILGDERDPITDVIGRRYVVPMFLVINILLPFFPWWGANSVLEHPEAGVKSILFQMSLSILLAWILLVIVRAVLISKGFEALGPSTYIEAASGPGGEQGMPGTACLEDPAESASIDSEIKVNGILPEAHRQKRQVRGCSPSTTDLLAGTGHSVEHSI